MRALLARAADHAGDGAVLLRAQTALRPAATGLASGLLSLGPVSGLLAARAR
ncbi:hypothetical protein [Actinocorallia longicatena]|uniref:Uncharacterized protein n=1 Tax=Actinocorallia longicatena TaxID=111803 RepID=A0ABP6QFD9_9ACTN